MLFVTKQNANPASAWVTKAGTVGKNFDLFTHIDY